MIEYELWGLNSENQSTFYSVYIDNREHRKEFGVNSGEVYPPLETGHPRAYFAEIDKVGLSSIQSDTDGISISIGFIFSGGEYRSNEKGWLLFRLEDGNLVPLERVRFRDEPFIIGIRVGMRALDDRPYRPLQFWFLDEDLAKAEIVEYLAN